MGNQEREKEREEKEGGGGKAEEWEGFHTCASFFPTSSLVSLNEVTPRRARLVLVRVTICRWVNRLGL